jgi:tetratricopeptide (TPR) repeat protein
MRPRRPTVHDHNSLGVHFYQVGAYDLAIAQLEQAVRLAPEVASLHFNLGGAYYGKGRVADAEREFRLALELVPDHARSHWFRGLCLERMGRLVEALEEFAWVCSRSAGTREDRSAKEEIRAITLALRTNGGPESEGILM